MSKVLVIEDEKDLRENIAELLENEHFSVIAAENGRIGIKLAQEQIPDLIICDVMMPEMDGHLVLKTLRQHPVTATIPFIFLTAKSTKNDFRQGMELGADDFLTKPFTASELLTAINSRLKKQAFIYKQSQKQLDNLRMSITLSLPHELRTPLNGILGFSQILSKDLDNLTNDEVREMAEYIHKSGERLHRLIQNFLLYAELEIISQEPEKIKKMQNSQSVFPTTALKKSIIDQAKKVGRETDLQIDFQSSCHLSICETKLHKIIEELLDNALKFSAPGTIIQIISNLSQNILTISFIDKGRGMTTAQINELGAYRQFERKLYEQQGSGLGLTIVKLLTELHGGGLKIYSQTEEKTVVQVFLPIIQNSLVYNRRNKL